ncbi:hypothetical protein MT325_m066L [Paramecium bursaria chlorella virus MT325]|uniref:Uncharacterized protein m066L n=1 Tax=Paramecium bursaria Chlorella virus MT325 TaxID=346932 RepID=A7ITE6_PBCVM|nr:hypothetical protein MT325_m066L [Paramecium bursaria chlorella virus MT325]
MAAVFVAIVVPVKNTLPLFAGVTDPILAMRGFPSPVLKGDRVMATAVHAEFMFPIGILNIIGWAPP